MAERRALIVAPLYGGNSSGLEMPPLAGTSLLRDRLAKCLREHGHYEVDVELAARYVSRAKLREKQREFFSVGEGGQLLYYFYGHGCLRDVIGVFVTSDGQPDDEGISMSDVVSLAQNSKAHEVVLIFDCCHAGAAIPAATSASVPTGDLSRPGCSILAACSEQQQGWETANRNHQLLGAYSAHVLDGLEGKATYGTTQVTINLLVEYIKTQFASWKQQPIADIHCAGRSYSFVVTSGFVPGVDQKTFCEMYRICESMIAEMGQLKQLHDLFQDLELSYRTVRDTYTDRHLHDNPQAWSCLRDAAEGENGVNTLIGRMSDLARQFCPGDDWVKKLIGARDSLQFALQDNSIEDLSAVRTRLRRVIQYQSKINVRLCEKARDLPMPSLINELRMIQSGLPTDGSSGEIRENFAAVVDQIANLESQESILIAEHDKWQELDDRLRAIEDQDMSLLTRDFERIRRQVEIELGQDVLDLHQEGIVEALSSGIAESLFHIEETESKLDALRVQLEEDVQPQVDVLCGTTTHDWANEIRTTLCTMRRLLKNGSTPPPVNSFATFLKMVPNLASTFITLRSLVTKQFRAVDHELLILCGERLPAEVRDLKSLLKRICGEDLPELATTSMPAETGETDDNR